MKKMILGTLTLFLAANLAVGCSSPQGGEAGSDGGPRPRATKEAGSEAGSEEGGSEEGGSEEGGSEAGSDTASTDATVMSHELCGVQFTKPAGWTDEKGDQGIAIHSPDGKVMVAFITPAEDDFEGAVDSVTKEMDKLIEDAKPDGDPEDTEVAGMKAVSMSGSGKMDGKEVAWSLDVIAAKRPMMVVSIAEKSALEEHGEEIQGLIDSFKPIDEAASEDGDEAASGEGEGEEGGSEEAGS